MGRRAMIYNEIDDYACRWLENLIVSGNLPKGKVVQKCIKELEPQEFEGANQAHLFAGIGGWPLALQMAGWPDHIKTLTGSCPCQPFSVAGKKKGKRRGFNDPRHLWPEMFRLIQGWQPSVVFGEQVASPDGIEWMQVVQSDLEKEGYEVGVLDLCAAGIGAYHLRQRLFWVGIWEAENMADSESRGIVAQKEVAEGGTSGILLRRSGEAIHMANTNIQRSQGHTRNGYQGDKPGRDGENAGGPITPPGFWSDPEWLLCRDDAYRPTQPGLSPLAHGLPRSLGKSSTREARMGLVSARGYRKGALIGYGNAIVPQLGAWFVKQVMDWMEALSDNRRS